MWMECSITFFMSGKIMNAWMFVFRGMTWIVWDTIWNSFKID